jgi:hypothetical protein
MGRTISFALFALVVANIIHLQAVAFRLNPIG